MQLTLLLQMETCERQYGVVYMIHFNRVFMMLFYCQIVLINDVIHY